MKRMNDFGSHWLFPTATAINRSRLLLPKLRDRLIVKRHALNLAHFPSMGEGYPSLEMDWSWIPGLEHERVGELRIDETIGGYDQLSVIFYKANVHLPNEDRCRIWILSVLQKEGQGFGDPLIRAFAAARNLVVWRHYDGSPQA